MRVPLVTLPEHPCPYLPGKRAEDRAIWAPSLPEGLYQQFMDAGFRRSGKLLYQPACRGCRACLSIRVLVDEFRAGKSQRRCLRRNQDLRITTGLPASSPEKLELYRKYTKLWHGKQEIETAAGFESFLYDSPLETTVEFEYRDDQSKLLAVGICDLCPQAMSSVYCYFDPEESKRALGTFAALTEIAFAAEAGVPFYYLGYWVRGCGSMEYKASFRPNEILCPDGIWRRHS